jgi:pimeloyl-ACP methyl ester carboxylesterase
MSRLVEYQIQNGGITLHVVGNPGAGRGPVAVAIVPGLSESADDWRGLIEYLSPIPSAAVTLRGRGKSTSPATGYSLADQSSDVASLVEHLPEHRIVLVAFSRSVAYALDYATRQPRKMARLVLLDYPPRHSSLRQGWAQAFAESEWRGRSAGTIVSPQALAAIERESDAKDFAAYLPSIQVPTLVIRAGAAGGALSKADASLYTASLPYCTLVELERSPHALWLPDASALYEHIAKFVREAASEA